MNEIRKDVPWCTTDEIEADVGEWMVAPITVQEAMNGEVAQFKRRLSRHPKINGDATKAKRRRRNSLARRSRKK